MAISIDDLNSFYDNVLFSDCANFVELIEKQNKTSGLANVYIQFNGKFILIKPEFLKLSEEVFMKINNISSCCNIKWRDGGFNEILELM